MKYDKIHLYTKKGDTETDLDADNAGLTADPTEKMLGILKSANILATVGPMGAVKSASG